MRVGLAQGLNDNAFGQEAIDKLLKDMEDHRNNLAVIVAGYSDETHDYIAPNEGLASRFNRYIEFSDYTVDQLVYIFRAKCAAEHYIPTEELITDLNTYLNSVDLNDFANGRGIRNLFEKMLPQQAKHKKRTIHGSIVRIAVKVSTIK